MMIGTNQYMLLRKGIDAFNREVVVLILDQYASRLHAQELGSPTDANHRYVAILGNLVDLQVFFIPRHLGACRGMGRMSV